MIKALSYTLLFAAFGQTLVAQKTGSSKQTAQAATQQTVQTPQSDGFTITGTIQGLPDGANILLLNGITGYQEQMEVAKNGRFSFKGKLDAPDFKILSFNGTPPYVTLFIDNANVSVTGQFSQLNALTITGSNSHDQYAQMMRELAAFEPVFNGQPASITEDIRQQGLSICAKYARHHSSTNLGAIALLRYTQLSELPGECEALFKGLTPAIQSGPLGEVVRGRVDDITKNAIGTVLADFSQADPAGNPISIKSLRGKYVLIDFWASWCRPCRQENPNVVASFERYKNKNYTVFGVSLDQKREPWLKAIEDDKLTWPQVSDLKGWQNEVAKQFGIQSIPQNFLIDPNGVIVGKNLRGPALEQKLAQLLD